MSVVGVQLPADAEHHAEMAVDALRHEAGRQQATQQHAGQRQQAQPVARVLAPQAVHSGMGRARGGVGVPAGTGTLMNLV